jgi:transcription elongation factor Elf1
MQFEVKDVVKTINGFENCPFCGSNDLKADADTLTYNRTRGLYEQNGNANIVCNGCKCFFTFPTGKGLSLKRHLNSLKKQWNTRN